MAHTKPRSWVTELKEQARFDPRSDIYSPFNRLLLDGLTGKRDRATSNESSLPKFCSISFTLYEVISSPKQKIVFNLLLDQLTCNRN